MELLLIVVGVVVAAIGAWKLLSQRFDEPEPKDPASRAAINISEIITTTPYFGFRMVRSLGHCLRHPRENALSWLLFFVGIVITWCGANCAG